GLAGRERLRQLEDRRLVLEVTLLRMARVGALPLLADLARAVASGEGGDAGPASAPAARRPAAAGAAVPAPAAAAPVAASGDPAARLRAWAERHRPSFLSTIEACSITMEGDVVTLTLASERKLHRDRLASPGVKQEVAQVLSESYGRPIVVQVRDAGAVNSAGPTPSAAGASAPAARRTVEPGEAVQRVAKRFDGRIIRSEDRAPE